MRFRSPKAIQSSKIQGILFLAFLLVYIPIFGVLGLADSKSPHFWIYAASAFLAVELPVIFCLDQVLLRAVLSPPAWAKWRGYWGAKTHWVLAIANTVGSTLVFGFLLLTCFFGDDMSRHDANKFGDFFLPALGVFVVFAYFHSLFRSCPTPFRGGICYGSFALLLVILGFWEWL